jgi:hypothetical protein
VPWNQELYFDLPPPLQIPQQHQAHHSSKVNSASSTTAHNNNSNSTAGTAAQQQQQQQLSQAAAVVSGMRNSVSRTYLAALGTVNNAGAAGGAATANASGNASDDDGTAVLSKELPVIRIGLSNGGEVLLRRQDILASKVQLISNYYC